jgi:MraZ protein
VRLIGSHEQKLDEKGRVVLPSAYRSELEHTKLILAAGKFGELGVWPIDEWDARVRAIQASEHDSEGAGVAFRQFTMNAHDVKLDGQFRFAISENLRKLAGFGTAGSQPLYIIGAMNRLEIWEKSLYDRTLVGAGK